MNKHWPRWVVASVTKHFDAAKESVSLYFDGDDRDTGELKDFSEFRIDGPRIKELSKNYWQLDVYVNILVQSTLDDKSAHRFLNTVGVMSAAFADSILVFKYGNGPDDDRNVLVGCLLFVKPDGLRINQFGIIDETIRTQQGTIEGHYRMHLQE